MSTKGLRNAAVFTFVVSMLILLVGGYFASEPMQTLGFRRAVPDTIIIVVGAFPLLYSLVTTYPRLRKSGESEP